MARVHCQSAEEVYIIQLEQLLAVQVDSEMFQRGIVLAKMAGLDRDVQVSGAHSLAASQSVLS